MADKELSESYEADNSILGEVRILINKSKPVIPIPKATQPSANDERVVANVCRANNNLFHN